MAVGQATTLYLIKTFYDLGTRTRGVRIGNGLISNANRPLVNTAMGMGKGPNINTIASLSNGFDVDIPSRGSVLMFACMNVGAGRMGVNAGERFGLALRSSGTVNRIMIINCNRRGGTSIINSVARAANRILRHTTNIDSINSTLANGLPKMIAVRNGNVPNRRRPRVVVHNSDS